MRGACFILCNIYCCLLAANSRRPNRKGLRNDKDKPLPPLLARVSGNIEVHESLYFFILTINKILIVININAVFCVVGLGFQRSPEEGFLERCHALRDASAGRLHHPVARPRPARKIRERVQVRFTPFKLFQMYKCIKVATFARYMYE